MAVAQDDGFTQASLWSKQVQDEVLQFIADFRRPKYEQPEHHVADETLLLTEIAHPLHPNYGAVRVRTS